MMTQPFVAVELLLKKLAIWPAAGSNAVLNTVIDIYSSLALQAQKLQ
jgi:hypothetical protein